MTKKWVELADGIAKKVKDSPGWLTLCVVDDNTEADAFEKYWQEHHSHVEVINRNQRLGSVLVMLRLKGSLQ